MKNPMSRFVIILHNYLSGLKKVYFGHLFVLFISFYSFDVNILTGINLVGFCCS